jgi:hypothetical protein
VVLQATAAAAAAAAGGGGAGVVEHVKAVRAYSQHCAMPDTGRTVVPGPDALCRKNWTLSPQSSATSKTQALLSFSGSITGAAGFSE